MSDEEFKRRRRSRNIVLAVLLFAFVGLMFVVSLVKMQGIS